jgi:hypothetical protein
MTALEQNVPYADDTSTNPDALKDRSGSTPAGQGVRRARRVTDGQKRPIAGIPRIAAKRSP